MELLKLMNISTIPLWNQLKTAEQECETLTCFSVQEVPTILENIGAIDSPPQTAQDLTLISIFFPHAKIEKSQQWYR